MILLIDNYDSFTYNLAHLFGELGAEILVRRNDAIAPDEPRKNATFPDLTHSAAASAVTFGRDS